MVQNSRTKQKLPELLPHFRGDHVDLTDPALFTEGSLSKSIKNTYVHYTSLKNSHLDYEMRSFLQDLAINKHVKANAFRQVLVLFEASFAAFMNEAHPDCTTIISIPHDELMSEYIGYCKANNLATTVNHTSLNRRNEHVRTTIRAPRLTMLDKYYSYVVSTYPDMVPESRDVLNVADRSDDFTIPSCPIQKISFEGIKQNWLRDVAKAFCNFRVRNKATNTIRGDIQFFNKFSDFIDGPCCHKEVDSLEAIDRSVSEDFIAYLRMKGLQQSTMNILLGKLKTVQNTCLLKGMPISGRPLVLSEDYGKRIAHDPDPFSPSELDQIRSHISSLPTEYYRIAIICIELGPRINDICSATILDENGHPSLREINGYTTFRFYMHKTRTWVTVSMESTSIAKAALSDAIDDSLKKYGSEAKYIFSASKNAPIKSRNVIRAINEMASKYDLKTDDGRPLRIKTHAFRRTVATNLIDQGADPNLVAASLGQSSTGNLKHYAKVHDSKMREVMQPIVKQNEELIKHMGDDQISDILDTPSDDEKGIPVPAGICAKPLASGLCDHANACLTCPMLVPSVRSLPVLERQLGDAKYQIVYAKLAGHTRLVQQLEELIANIEHIINVIGEKREEHVN